VASASRAEYDRRMHRVLAHIDAHLDAPLDLAQLAEVAHFSPFHFHRLFAAWMGETLGDYLRRRRVEVAAMRLATQPALSVLHAALGVGFGSGEAFSRAFKARFGASPSLWREQERTRRWQTHSNPDQGLSKFDQAGAAPCDDHGHTATRLETPDMSTHPSLNVRLVEREARSVAYLRHIGPYGEPIGRFWREQFQPWVLRHGWQARPRYGIGYDDPSITDPAQCRYDTCVELPEGLQPPRDMLTMTLPGGRYAVLDFEGTPAQIGQAWQALFRDWLPDSGLQMDARPCFEHYPADARYDAATGTFSCEICVAVAPL
jgi:AraC family transcriptional regulator